MKSRRVTWELISSSSGGSAWQCEIWNLFFTLILCTFMYMYSLFV
jgi:hypothetical protein